MSWHDDADRLFTVTDAANNVTTYGYDTEGNLTSIKDANNTTSFALVDSVLERAAQMALEERRVRYRRQVIRAQDLQVFGIRHECASR